MQATLEPSMRDLQHQLRLSRREFAKQSRIAEAKRMQLEVLLSSALTVGSTRVGVSACLDLLTLFSLCLLA